MSKYKVRIKSVDERQREIGLRCAEAISKGQLRQEYKFRSGRENLPLVTVPYDYLVYRLENYRTRDQQLSVIAEGKAPPAFFDPMRREDPSVQHAQHGLLLEQAMRGSGATIKAIYDELERIKEQTEHLIITDAGVVVNGNRRLAAMRELLADDPQMYSGFVNVLCLVLPGSATASEILELEIGLQMQPETKLPYEWTAIGRAARDLRQQNFEEAKIARLMNRSVQDIQRAITMIDAADLYLSEWLGKPNSYTLLNGTEQAFAQVATRNWGRDDQPQLRETTRKFDFFVIEHRDVISQSAYDLINKIELNPADFLNQVALEWDVPVPERADQSAGDLEISFDDASATTKDYSGLVGTLLHARNDKEQAKARMGSLAQVCEIVGEQSREKGKAALKFAKSADKALHAINLRTSDPATWGDIYSLLKASEERCGELITLIETRRGAMRT